MKTVLIRAWALVGLAAVVAIPAAAEAQEKRCRMNAVATMPVTFRGNRPLIEGEINGRKVKIEPNPILWQSTLYRHVVSEQKLRVHDSQGAFVYGPRGPVRPGVSTLKTLSLGGFTVANQEFLVATEERADDPEVALVLGRDLLSTVDIEFDYAHSVIRLFRTVDCEGKPLAYWGPDFGVVDLDLRTSVYSPPLIKVTLNGKPVDAEINPAVDTSILTERAARRLGVTSPAPGTLPQSRAISGRVVNMWVGVFASFSIGDETIKNAKLRVADMFLRNEATGLGTRNAESTFDDRMTLGGDFFRSHRVLVANSQKKFYFSYIGGPVFQVVDPAGSRPGDAP